MDKRVVMLMLFLLTVSPAFGAQETLDELSSVRRQAQVQRHKEEELQLLRLELEKLKLEAELRKTTAEMFPAGNGPSLTAGTARVNVEVKSITITSDGARAAVERDGARQFVRQGDALGGLTVKTISGSEVIFVDEKGAETRIPVRL